MQWYGGLAQIVAKLLCWFFPAEGDNLMNRHASAEGWMPKCQVVCKVGYCGARWGSSQGALVLQRWHMCCLTVTDDSEISTIDPTISSNVLTEAAVEFTSDEYVKSAATEG